MPATQARGGFGIQLLRDDGAGNFNAVAEIMDVTGPERSAVVVDATNNGSPNGWAEKIATGLKEAGDVTFQMSFIEGDSSQALLLADLEAGIKRAFRLVHPTGTKRQSFSAYVQKVGFSYPMRDKMVSDVTLSVTGRPLLEAHP